MKPAFAARAKDWPEHLASIIDQDELVRAPIETLAALALEDVALALAAASGDREAIAAIEKTIIEPLPRTLSRLKLTSEVIDDLRQELREKLFLGDRPKLLEYRGRGPLGAWARVMALRTAYDRARTSTRQAKDTTHDDDALAALMDGADPPDIAQLRAKYATELRAAFQAAVKRLDPEERAVLRSHTIDALTIDQIGALYQVHRATAARWVQHARSSLLDALRSELAQRLGDKAEDAAGLKSVVALVGSRIDLSMSRVLQDED